MKRSDYYCIFIIIVGVLSSAFSYAGLIKCHRCDLHYDRNKQYITCPHNEIRRTRIFIPLSFNNPVKPTSKNLTLPSVHSNIRPFASAQPTSKHLGLAAVRQNIGLNNLFSPERLTAFRNSTLYELFKAFHPYPESMDTTPYLTTVFWLYAPIKFLFPRHTFPMKAPVWPTELAILHFKLKCPVFNIKHPKNEERAILAYLQEKRHPTLDPNNIILMDTLATQSNSSSQKLETYLTKHSNTIAVFSFGEIIYSLIQIKSKLEASFKLTRYTTEAGHPHLTAFTMPMTSQNLTDLLETINEEERIIFVYKIKTPEHPFQQHYIHCSAN